MEILDSAKIKALSELTGSAERICVVAHTHPDGDAVGSSVAARQFFGPERTTIVLPDALPASLDFISADEGIVIAEAVVPGDTSGKRVAGKSEAASVLNAADLLLCLDFNAFRRAGCLEPLLSGFKGRKILIDHHLNPDSAQFDLVFSDTEVSSTCELLYFILRALQRLRGDEGKALPPLCARALMTGMTTDTNNFDNSVHPTTLEMASSLLAEGVDRDEVLDNIYRSYNENRLRLMSVFLRDFKVTPEGVAYYVLRKELIREMYIREGDTEAFVNMPLAVRNVKMSLLLKEDDGFFRVSIRSKKGVSANRLAMDSFHGGGHEQASGGRLFFPGDIENTSEADCYIEKETARFMRDVQTV